MPSKTKNEKSRVSLVAVSDATTLCVSSHLGAQRPALSLDHCEPHILLTNKANQKECPPGVIYMHPSVPSAYKILPSKWQDVSLRDEGWISLRQAYQAQRGVLIREYLAPLQPKYIDRRLLRVPRPCCALRGVSGTYDSQIRSSTSAPYANVRVVITRSSWRHYCTIQTQQPRAVGAVPQKVAARHT